MNVSCKGVLVVFMLASLLGLAACKQEGPGEKAGIKVDKAVEQADRKIEKSGDALSDKTKQAGTSMDDSAITAQIMAAIANDPALKMSQIMVTTTNGAVRLSGAVDSPQSIDRALEITRNVKGVISTENNLVVKSTK